MCGWQRITANLGMAWLETPRDYFDFDLVVALLELEEPCLKHVPQAALNTVKFVEQAVEMALGTQLGWNAGVLNFLQEVARSERRPMPSSLRWSWMSWLWRAQWCASNFCSPGHWSSRSPPSLPGSRFRGSVHGGEHDLERDATRITSIRRYHERVAVSGRGCHKSLNHPCLSNIDGILSFWYWCRMFVLCQ